MGLIAWYKLDGNVNDSSGNGYNGTTSGSWSYSDGKISQAGVFDGIASGTPTYFSSNIVNQITDKYTVMCWFYPTRLEAGKESYGNTLLATSSRYGIWLLHHNGKIRVYAFESDPSTASSYLTTLTPIELNKWYHVAISATRSGEVKIYINGEFLESFTASDDTAWAGVFGVGDLRASRGLAHEGKIDDVRVYDEILSTKQIYNISKAKVTHLKLNGESLDNSGYGYNGTPQASVSYSEESVLHSKAFENVDGGVNKSITINNGNQNITGDQTIAMWLYPTSFSGRRNPWNKAYGGEGTITQETNATLNYYWGTHGGNSSPYQGFGSSSSLTINEWNHIAIVRHLSAATPILRWYINGVQTNTVSPSYTAATATTTATTIGSGYAGNYQGKISDVRQYATALSADDIRALYEVRGNFDNKGNVFVNELVETKHKPLIMDYTLWENGQTGSISPFISWSVGNARVIAQDPWGKDTVVWKSGEGGTVDYPSQGGIYFSAFPIDNTKLYRMSWWEKRHTNGTGTYGRYYAGLNGYGSTNGVWNLSNETYNTNPYFWSANHNQLPVGEWFLIVGHVWPYTYTDGVKHPDSGRFYVDGTKIGDINTDYRWGLLTTTGRSRTLAIYRGDTDDMIHYTAYPRIDICDGTEPTLQDLLAEHDSRNETYIRSVGATTNRPLDLHSNITYITDIDEISGTQNPNASVEITKSGALVINGEFSEVD